MKKFKLLKKKEEDSSKAPASSNARAEYYASRSVVNPLDSRNHPATAAAGHNPFGDDSDDDEDLLAGFSRKKPATAGSGSDGRADFSTSLPSSADHPALPGRSKTVGGSPSNPFDDNTNNRGSSNPFDDGSGGGGSDVLTESRSTSNQSSEKTRSNPFDDESVVDKSGTSGNNSKNPFDDSPERSGKIKNNPFDDESNATGPSGGKSARSTRPISNPIKETTPPPRSNGARDTNPFDSPQRTMTKSDRTNPTLFDSPKKNQSVTEEEGNASKNNVKSASKESANRPSHQLLSKSSAVAGGGIARSQNQHVVSKPSIPQRSVSHGTSQGVDNFASYNPSSAATATAPTTSGMMTDKRKLWRGFVSNNNNPDNMEGTRPILENMDEESLPPSQHQRHNTSTQAAGLASWLRLNKKEDDEIKFSSSSRPPPSSSSSNNNNNAAVKVEKKSIKKKRTKKKCTITAWPFDNFHEVQEQQSQLYEELASRAASEYNTVREEDNDYVSSEDEEAILTMNDVNINTNVDTKYYERPEELISIKEAVTNLPLVDFEKKAEERAINIVSTWLFDAGLIDELLVNGAMPPPLPPPTSPDRTIQSSEGVEVGQHGFPLLGGESAELKIDKETNKLRGMIQRDLSIINARLNDGVAASGLEVQELVNAVAATKEDIGRLRELTTYISDSQMSERDEFLLAKYPYLRRAINARRNINRCFRELEFFSQIPSTCDRLRDELHGGEWTEEEWSTIRNVAMEHVELEIMLVEAEVSMKAGHNFNDAMVDNFLDSHVQNVWELGDEIRMRMLSGIGSAFELAINNPAGMVALVEAVEVYEKAAESFEKKRRESTVEDSGKLRFTNMRAAALEQLYQDFELRGVEMFRGVHEQAADIAEEEDASNTQFTAVLKAATELVTEIDIVKHQMSPCFAPHWHVEALWSSCVAHVCSNHIVQQIGGPDGQNLPELTITQLLELVAWVEYFRETIEETFPEVAEMRDTKKTYFEERPDLFGADKRTVNMRNATDSLAWVNNMLWEVHRLAQEEFLVRTRSQTDEWLEKVYESETVKNQSSEGKLTTSLCEDVFSFSSVQLRTIRERLSKKSDALILAVCIILSHMRSKQVHSRNNFLQDLETCCAASNDFTRMSEKCEDVCTDLISQCEFSEDMIATVEASSNELMVVYSSDAVYAARSVHIYVFDPIEEEIGTRLFEQAWEEDMVGNDLALSLIRTLEDFYDDLVHFMDDFMVVKSVMSLMSATVIFYVKCLLTRAERHRSNKKPYFGDVQTALNRITGDIKVMREYFEGLVPKMPALKKNIEKDFEILSTVHELMSIAAGLSISEAEDFILVLQKRVRDVSITKHIVGDLWHLVAPTDERYVWELVESMEEQLVAIAPADDALALEVNDRSYVKGLRLDEMAVKLYVKSKRNRPVKSTATEKIINNWRTTWAVRAEDGNIDDNNELY